MVSQYKEICRNYERRAKAFIQMSVSLDKQIGKPDFLVLFTSTVSHKTIRYALDEVGSGTEVVCRHTSSGIALTEIPKERCAAYAG